MVATILALSDLHLADGAPRLENWGAAQQDALVGLLNATRPGRPLASETVELVINGDCFDFLLAWPALPEHTRTDVEAAHVKWAGIAAAHAEWFAALRVFLAAPGRTITFLIGNHDLELHYPSVRARVRAAIGGPPGAVRFCLTRAYRPLPDVLIEHGCQYDPWNVIPALWADQPEVSTPTQLEAYDATGAAGPTALPWGSQYFYRVFLPAKQRLPYLDACAPGLTLLRQLALLCQIAPELVRAGAPALQSLMRAHSDALVAARDDTSLTAGQLFVQLLLATQQLANEVGPDAPEDPHTMRELERLITAFGAADHDATLEAMFTLGDDAAHDGATTDAGALECLTNDPVTRLMVIGHTHEEGRVQLPTGQALLNTGTWFPRLRRPHPDAWTSGLGYWVEYPDAPYPGASGNRFTCAWLRSEPGAATVGELIAWDGDAFTPVADDAYRRW